MDGLTVPDLLRLRVEADPARVALTVDGERSLTFADWERRSDAVARGMFRLGTRRGDRVGMLYGSDGWIEYAIGYIATHKLGAAAVHLSDRMSAPQVTYRLSAGRASGLLHAAGLRPPALDRWAATVESLEHAGGGPADLGTRPEDVADIAFTSGTTSRPKAVAVTHANLTYGRGTGPDDRLFPGEEMFLSAWSTGTNASQATLVSALTAHPAALTAARLDPGHLCELIARLRVGAVMLSPATALALADTRLASRYDLSSVRAVGIGSAPVLPATRRALSATFPDAAVAVMYSSAESSPAFTRLILPPWAKHRDPRLFDSQVLRWSVGQPSGGTEILITDAAGHSLPPGDVGEVSLRSPAPARSYDHDPQASALVFGGGWIRTGDLGHLDREGFLYLFDRASDAIHAHGRTISTVRIEAALADHPAVAEAAAFGVPDGPAGQSVAAAIVPREPVAGPAREVLLAGLRACAAERLEPHEVPATIRLLDSLPRNLMGKVVKRRLQGLAAAGPSRPPLSA